MVEDSSVHEYPIVVWQWRWHAARAQLLDGGCFAYEKEVNEGLRMFICRAKGRLIARWITSIVFILAVGVAGGAEFPALQKIHQATLQIGDHVEPVVLPHSLNRATTAGLFQYRLAFTGPEVATQPWSLYLPRAGNRFHVHVNGTLVAEFGTLGPSDDDYSQRSNLVYLPSAVLRQGNNDILIEVWADKARYGGLSVVEVGPVDLIKPRYLWREAVQTWGSLAIISLSVAFAVVSLIVAVAVRERAFWIFALACTFCAIRTSYAVVVHPPLPYPWWNWVVDSCYAGYVVCLLTFCSNLLHVRSRLLNWAIATLIASSTLLIPLHAFWRMAAARQAWLTLMLCLAGLVCLVVVLHWLRYRTRQAAVLSAAGSATLALGLYDHLLVFYLPGGYSSFALIRYSLLMFLVAIGWLLLDYLRSSERATRDVEDRARGELALRRSELELEFDRQQVLARQTAKTTERARLLSDIHDGMGLQLTGLLALVERGPMQREQLASEVRTTIEQMRMLVHSTEQFDGDFSFLLGHIRYQLERRLAHTSITLNWRVRLPDSTPFSISADKAIAMQRLFFELTTNAIRHSGCNQVEFQAELHAPPKSGVRLEFSDNGTGFDPLTKSRGTGVASVGRRIEDLGGQGGYKSAAGAGATFWLDLALEPKQSSPEIQ
jgi:signal transduction histidine kinase